MSDIDTIIAEKRDVQGTSASRRLRHAGKVPAVLYGAGKDPELLTLDHNSIFHNLENEAFHSSILTVEVAGKKEKAILRDVQMHPFKPIVVHMDLQRISAKDKIHMSVPLHFTGEDVAPGVKLENGVASHLITELDIICLPADLPEYIEVDVSDMHIGDTIHLSEIKLPEGVESTTLAHGGDDQAVVTIATVRAAPTTEEEEEGEAAGEVAEAEGEEAAGEEAEGED
jgi:large subunit ribosomal protein L25